MLDLLIRIQEREERNLKECVIFVVKLKKYCAKFTMKNINFEVDIYIRHVHNRYTCILKRPYDSISSQETTVGIN